MSRDRVRYWMIALLAAAALLSVLGRTLNNVWVGQLSVIAFFGAVGRAVVGAAGRGPAAGR